MFAAAAGQEFSTFSGCDPAQYYNSLSALPTRQDLHDKLRTTHRKSLPYTSSSVPDTWDALLDLDGVVDATTGAEHVKLIYARGETIAAEPRGTSDTWNREHIYPKSAGVGTGGFDYTDLFALRPSLSRVNSARGNKWFGHCGIEAEGSGTCRQPAHDLAAADTETDSLAWLPPADVRGDIARALFYMDLRYDGDGEELDLVLSDCTEDVLDDGRVNELGYLSELLRWHMDDPVDEEERNRNDRICRMWQGNRNPFVDNPGWVETYFGKPAALTIDNGGGYASCIDDAATIVDGGLDHELYPLPPEDEEEGGEDVGVSPTSGEGSCNGLEVGDVAVIAAGSDDPDSFQLVALADIQPGSEIYVTDNAYTGYQLRDNEGTVKFKVDEWIPAGSTIIYYNASPEWEAVGGSFSLSASGDTVIVYCTSGKGGGESGVTFLSALSYSGDFFDPDESGSIFGSSKSALPPVEIKRENQGFFSFLAGLQFAATALDHEDNVWYVGPTEGSKDDLWSYLADPAYWEGSNTESPAVGGDFIVSIEEAEAKSGGTGPFGGGPHCLLAVLIWMLCW